MTRRSDMYMTGYQWMKHREQELNRLKALEASAAAAGLALQPSAPEHAVCDFCAGRIVGGICGTCEAVYVDGIRVPKQYPKAIDGL